MKSYPPEHREIVAALLDGKFLLQTNPAFAPLNTLQDEYRQFFAESFGHELVLDTEIAYLRSAESAEKDTRNFTLFLAILCRELDLAGKDFREEISSKNFDISVVEAMLQQSSKWAMLERIIGKDFKQFLTKWFFKGVLQNVGANSFKFTKAVKVFFAFATDIARTKLAQSEPTKP